jgi:elongator complex protein 3
MTNDINEKIIIEAVKKKKLTKNGLDKLKRTVAGGFKLPPPPTSSLNKAYHKLLKSKKIKPSADLELLLTRRAVRTLSGIAPITVLTKPAPCPGKCVYCPTELTMPKSYISNEPAAMRALLLRFDPYAQMTRRLQAMRDNGHPTDKIELIVKGGTWSAYEWKYQKWFIKRCFDAANSFYAKRKSSKNLEQAQKKNERAKNRIIGLTLETRPDWITPKEILQLRELGCTRVELGIQTLDNKILDLVKRGHYTDWVIYATHLLKDAGFKVDYHMMPALPGSTPAKDIKIFKELFDDDRYRPDMIKIYPCVILPNSEIYQWWKKGKYKPWSEKTMIKTFAKIKSFIPRYVRISRLIRDFPAPDIAAGTHISNLREAVQKEMKKQKIKCKCLRCREIGHNPDIDAIKIKPKLFIEKYKASGGTEYFLSFEDPKRRIVFAFLRLRIPSPANQTILKILPELENCALIRELHTYGHLVGLTKKSKLAAQHKGLGKKLMKQAEQIAKKEKLKHIAVISGIGVREYYKALGYKIKGSYMVK